MSFNGKPEKMPFTKTLMRGMQGPEVSQLQMWLNEMNDYYQFNKIQKTLPETGFYGDQTVRMIMAFQAFWSYSPTGVYDAKTHDLMEWKYYNYISNNQIAMQRARQNAIMGNSRHW